MSLCIPGSAGSSLDATVYGQIGSAPDLTLVDPERWAIRVPYNGGDRHGHSALPPPG